MHVNGTDRFRCVSLFGTLLAGICTLVILVLDPRTCTDVKLENAMYICFGVHIFTFLLLLASYICSDYVIALGRGMSVFYLMQVGGMIAAQIIFFNG